MLAVPVSMTVADSDAVHVQTLGELLGKCIQCYSRAKRPIHREVTEDSSAIRLYAQERSVPKCRL